MMVASVQTVSRSLAGTLLAVAALSAAAIWCGVLLKMTWAGAIGLYFVVWWTVLFVVLPFAVRSQAELGEVSAGTDPGAPATPALRERAIWTTIVSAATYILAAALMPLSGL